MKRQFLILTLLVCQTMAFAEGSARFEYRKGIFSAQGTNIQIFTLKGKDNSINTIRIE